MTRYGTTQLYRLFDGDVLVYIGISRDYHRHRRLDHARRYGNKIADNPVIEIYELRFEAEIAEVIAQYLEEPRDGSYRTTLSEVNREIDKITARYAEHPDRLQTDIERSPTHLLENLLELQ
jgi:hypothetical protein